MCCSHPKRDALSSTFMASQADELPAPPAAAISSDSVGQQAAATSTASSSSDDRLQPEADEGDTVDVPADVGQTAVDAGVGAEEVQRPDGAGSPPAGELHLPHCTI